MNMNFPSDMPIWEQLKRSSERKRVGRKHNHKVGPTRQKNPPQQSVKRVAAWRKYHEQVALYFRGLRDTMPAKPIIF